MSSARHLRHTAAISLVAVVFVALSGLGPARALFAFAHPGPAAAHPAALSLVQANTATGAHWATLRPSGTDLADAPRHANVPATLAQAGLALTLLALLGIAATWHQRMVRPGGPALPGVRGPPRLAS
jgi:hypothetical protein